MAFSHQDRTDANDNTYIVPYQRPSFISNASTVAIGNNKSMISILNTSTKIVRLERIYLVNNQTTAITGVISNFQFHRITSHSAGTLITAEAFDTNDSLDSGVTIRTGATVSGEGAILKRVVYSSDEWGVGASDNESLHNIQQQIMPIFQSGLFFKPYILRQNQGFHIKHTVNSTIGNFDFFIEFTVDTE